MNEGDYEGLSNRYNQCSGFISIIVDLILDIIHTCNVMALFHCRFLGVEKQAWVIAYGKGHGKIHTPPGKHVVQVYTFPLLAAWINLRCSLVVGCICLSLIFNGCVLGWGFNCNLRALCL